MDSFAQTLIENAPKLLLISVIGLIAAVIALALISWAKQQHFRKFIGPRPFPLIGNLHQMVPRLRNLIPWMSNTLTKYGESVTLWMGPQMILLTCDPNVIQAYYQSKQSNENFVKGTSDVILSACVGDGVMTADGEKWKHNRKVISPTFSQVIVKHFIPIFEKNSKILVKELRVKADGETRFPMYEFLAQYLIRTILETAMQMENTSENIEIAFKLLPNVENVMDCIITRTFAPWMHPDFVFQRTQTGKRFYKNFEPIMSYLRRIYFQAKERMKRSDFTEAWKNNVFINRLISREDFDDHQILEEMTTLLAAGYATSLCAFGYTLLLLGLHPEIQRSVYEEDQTIQKLIGDSPLTASHINQYELLDRVIKESMRLCTVIPLIFRHLTEDLKCDDVVFPKGTDFMIDLKMTHNNPKYFPNPHIFDPDRFLPENVSKRHPYAYLPFSLGSRMCLGYKFSQTSLRISIAAVVRNFKIINNMPLESLKLQTDMTIKDLDGFQLVLEPRSE